MSSGLQALPARRSSAAYCAASAVLAAGAPAQRIFLQSLLSAQHMALQLTYEGSSYLPDRINRNCQSQYPSIEVKLALRQLTHLLPGHAVIRHPRAVIVMVANLLLRHLAIARAKALPRRCHLLLHHLEVVMLPHLRSHHPLRLRIHHPLRVGVAPLPARRQAHRRWRWLPDLFGAMNVLVWRIICKACPATFSHIFHQIICALQTMLTSTRQRCKVSQSVCKPFMQVK